MKYLIDIYLQIINIEYLCLFEEHGTCSIKAVFFRINSFSEKFSKESLTSSLVVKDSLATD